MIFIGEIRDAEPPAAAIQAAETGHLSSRPSTRSTHGDDQPCARPVPARAAARDPDLVRGARSADRVAAARTRADGKGRVPVVEVLVNTGRVFDRIVDPTRRPGSRRRDRGRRVLRDADVRPGAREAREGGPSPPMRRAGPRRTRTTSISRLQRDAPSGVGRLRRTPPPATVSPQVYATSASAARRASSIGWPPVPVRDHEQEVHGDEQGPPRHVLRTWCLRVRAGPSSGRADTTTKPTVIAVRPILGSSGVSPRHGDRT